MNRGEIEEVVERLKAQHPEVCVGKVPVQFSPDQVRKMLVEMSKRPAKLRIEYDDGRSSKSDKDKVPLCTRKDRASGFYVVYPDGTEKAIGIGFMRVSEMAGLEEILNEIA